MSEPATNLVEVSVTRPQLALNDVDQSIVFAQSFKVVDEESAEIAAAELYANMDRGKAITEMYEELALPFKNALAKIATWFKPEIDKCARAEALWKAQLAQYHKALQEKARQEQIRAREAQQLEQERLAREAAKREEEGRLQRDQLRAEAKLQADAGNATASAELARRAEHAEVAGQQDAQELVEQLYLTPTAPVEQAKLPSGLSSRTLWTDVEVFDLRALAQACLDGNQPMVYLMPNLIALRQTAVAQKDEMRIPGVRVRPRTVIASKSKAKA